MGRGVSGVCKDQISVHFSIDPESPINLYVTKDLTQHLLNHFSSFSGVAGLPSDWLQVFGTEAAMALVKGKLDMIRQNGPVSPLQSAELALKQRLKLLHTCERTRRCSNSFKALCQYFCDRMLKKAFCVIYRHPIWWSVIISR